MTFEEIEECFNASNIWIHYMVTHIKLNIDIDYINKNNELLYPLKYYPIEKHKIPCNTITEFINYKEFFYVNSMSYIEYWKKRM